MKLQMKLAAVAAALVAAAGSAHADLTAGNNGSLALVAFNQTTRAYYIRDLGYLMNDFLPSSVTTLSGDGGVTGNKSPEAGLTLDKTTNTSFADSASWGTWLTGQTPADIRWFVSSVDTVGTATATNVKRVITTLATVPPIVTNGNVDNYIASGAAGGIALFAGTFGLSTTGNPAPGNFDNNFGLGGTGALATLDQDVGLFYFARTTGTGSTTAAATKVQFGNSLSFASVKLAGNGDFSYTLAPAAAVPLPAAVWLMGAGLMAVGGVVRRRKATAQA
jgi:hypothetical protein